MMKRPEVDALCVVESIGRVVVKGRGGRLVEGLPIGIESGERA
jgi:hypothetical protein